MTPVLAQDTAPVNVVHPVWVHVVVTGSVPGYTTSQLTQYLVVAMRKSVPQPWVMTADPTIIAGNRVDWRFKTLRTIWKGGSHSGFPSQDNVVTYISAEVRTYIKGEYQMTLALHPSILSQNEDQALADMAREASRILFVQNAPKLN